VRASRCDGRAEAAETAMPTVRGFDPRVHAGVWRATSSASISSGGGSSPRRISTTGRVGEGVSSRMTAPLRMTMSASALKRLRTACSSAPSGTSVRRSFK